MQIIFTGKGSYYFSKVYLIFEITATGENPQGKLILLRENTFRLLIGIRVKNMPRSVFIEGNAENIGICYPFGNNYTYLH